MAIELDDRITVLETKDMKARYKAACKEQGADMSEVLRPHVRAYVEAWEAKKNQPVPPT